MFNFSLNSQNTNRIAIKYVRLDIGDECTNLCMNYLWGRWNVNMIIQLCKCLLRRRLKYQGLIFFLCVYFFLISRIWKKFVFPVPTCLYRQDWHCHFTSYFFDGRPSAPAGVSNVCIATSFPLLLFYEWNIWCIMYVKI